jgi:FkbM family methyltransferase
MIREISQKSAITAFLYSLARRGWHGMRATRQGLARRWVEYRYRARIVPVPPVYYIVDKLTANSVMIDLGTGADANLSQGLIARYGLRSYGFDPTRKHHPHLDTVVARTGEHFQYYPYAISGMSGIHRFFESQENVSGSFSADHSNIQCDTVVAYEVQAITLTEVFGLLELEQVDLLKMDIEGEEYSTLQAVEPALIRQIDQLIVEFHHHCIDHVTLADTKAAVQRLVEIGFRPYTVDGVNYLFFQVSY